MFFAEPQFPHFLFFVFLFGFSSKFRETMSKSVIGVDLGSHAVVCAVRTGGGAPELVHNEASEIQTTPAVSLRARCGGGAGGAGGVAAAVRAAVSGRAVGGGAAQLVATRPAESVASVTAAVWSAPDGPGLTVGPEGAERAFAPDQLLAMLLAATLDAAVAKLGVASTDGGLCCDSDSFINLAETGEKKKKKKKKKKKLLNHAVRN
jgi:molecular chaperone DnaK (HSP70)